MKKILLAFGLLLFASFCTANNALTRLDSMYQITKSHPTLQNVDALNSAIKHIYFRETDTCIFYTKEQIRISKRNNFPSFLARGYNMLGVCMEFQNNLDSAISLYKLALAVPIESNQDQFLLEVYNNLGISYSYKGLYNFSLDYTLRALKIAEALHDEKKIAMVQNNIGLRYSELSNQKKAIEHFRKALAINNKLLAEDPENRINRTSNYINLGRAFLFNKQIDSANYYYKLALSEKGSNDFDAMIIYSGLCYVALEDKNYNQAQLYNDSSLYFANHINDDLGIQDYNLQQGVILNATGNYAEALTYLRKHKRWAEKNGYTSSYGLLYKQIAQVYKAMHEPESAFVYIDKYAQIIDSSFSKDKDLAMDQVSLYKEEKQQNEKDLLNTKIKLNEQEITYQKNIRNTLMLVGILLIISIISLISRYIILNKSKKKLAQKNIEISEAKDQSEQLLLNILPAEVAEELKLNGESKAKNFEHVTVLFTDFISFTQISENLSAQNLVKELNIYFKAFDEISTKYKLEKIKTIGDSYMVAGGLGNQNPDSVKNVVLAALEMQAFIRSKVQTSTQNHQPFLMRCGINTGPVVAGIVGVKKFQYDIWGDSVNTAARMENSCESGQVNVSETTYEMLKSYPEFTFEYRGLIEAKNKGKLSMWYVSQKHV